MRVRHLNAKSICRRRQSVTVQGIPLTGLSSYPRIDGSGPAFANGSQSPR
jgi:hypothetical protein